MGKLQITFRKEGKPVIVEEPTEEMITQTLTGRQVRKPTQDELDALYRGMNNLLGRGGATTRREVRRKITQP